MPIAHAATAIIIAATIQAPPLTRKESRHLASTWATAARGWRTNPCSLSLRSPRVGVCPRASRAPGARLGLGGSFPEAARVVMASR